MAHRPNRSDASHRLDRRTALSAVAVAGVGAPLLAACGSDEQTAAEPTGAASSSPAGEGSTSPSPSEQGSEPGGGTGGDVFAKAADVPVGGCAVYADVKLVVTQPTEGDFKCFSAVCTHQGCLVSSASDGVIPCKCHSSQFSLQDGSPQSGPATAPLEPVEIVVDGDNIALA